MRLGVFALVVVIVLAAAIMQVITLQPTKAETTHPAITACAVQGGGCPSVSLDSTPGTVLSHNVFEGGCGGSDLHVVRYAPENSPSASLVATWCT